MATKVSPTRYVQLVNEKLQQHGDAGVTVHLYPEGSGDGATGIDWTPRDAASAGAVAKAEAALKDDVEVDPPMRPVKG